MEVLTFITVVVILIILLINISGISKRLNILHKEVEHLRQSLQNEKEAENIPEKAVFTKERPVQSVNCIESEKKPVTASSYEDTVRAKMEALANESIPRKPNFSEPAKTFKQPTDFEKFIGENLISKIGIIILVLGIGLFVKYAIDKQWIGVYGRTAIGLLTGGVLISTAHYLRKSYKTFSSLLTGGGLAVFYLTIAIAFHQYHIFSQTAAFILMVVITIFSVLLSLVYDKKELAIFSQLGGYAAPFMISTGEGNYRILFTYVLILNAGLLTLAWFKLWHVLNLLAFFFTVVIFSGWIAVSFWGSTDMPYMEALIFASAFYVIFFLVNILNNLKERKPFNATEIMMIISNNFFYFLWGMAILYSYQKGIYKGLFTVLAGLFNFVWVFFLYRRDQADRNLIYVLIAMVMSFISLAIPIQLNGHSVTLFWTAELTILLWLSQVTGIKILRAGHLVILFLTVISLMMDWKMYQDDVRLLPEIFNRTFITGLFVIAGLYLTSLLLKKERDIVFVKNAITVPAYRNLITITMIVLAFMVPFLELIYQVNVHYPAGAFKTVILSVYIYAYLFIALYFLKTPGKIFNSIYIVSWIALFLYMVIYHRNVIILRDWYVYGKNITAGNFISHYLAIPFVTGIVIILGKRQQIALRESGTFSKLHLWFASFLLIFIASAELDNILVLVSGVTKSNYHQLLELSHKAGYPILWGVCAFILVMLGIRKKEKTFRIQALTLFALIILKLFLFDVWNMSEGGRIAAFVFLGIVLLVVSFLYQKLKNLFLDSGENVRHDVYE